MSHLHSPDKEVNNAADAVRSLIERLEYANFYQDVQKGSNTTILDKLRDLDGLLVRASAGIRRYSNTSVPINHCPNEILSEIFALSATKELSSFSSGRVHVSFVIIQELLPITWVCRAWRTMMHSTPSLWRDIVLGGGRSKRFISHGLALQGKDLPLRLYARKLRKNVKSGTNEAMDMLQDYGDRFQEIYLQVEKLQWSQIFGSLPAHPPLLIRLDIVSRCRIYPTGESSPGTYYFGGVAQSLRRLRLHGVPSLPMDQFLNLTSFNVSDINVYPLPTILSVLSNMPKLEVLSFALAIEQGSSAQCARDAVVELPHLRQFTKHYNISFFCDILQLLRMVRFPSTCIVQVDEQKHNDIASIIRVLYRDAFPQNLTRLRIMPYVHPGPSLSYGIKPTVQYFLEVLNDAGTSGLILGIHSRELNQNGLWSPTPNEVTDTLVNLLSSAAAVELVSNVRELWVHKWADLVNNRLLAVIPPIDTLGLVLAQTLYGPTKIPEAIVEPTEDGTFRHFLNLTSLYVYTCRVEDVDRIRMAALARKEAGRPLHRLAIECERKSGSGVESQALKLEELVRELWVTVVDERQAFAWWKPCVVPEGWSRHGVCPWPDRWEY